MNKEKGLWQVVDLNFETSITSVEDTPFGVRAIEGYSLTDEEASLIAAAPEMFVALQNAILMLEKPTDVFEAYKSLHLIELKELLFKIGGKV